MIYSFYHPLLKFRNLIQSLVTSGRVSYSLSPFAEVQEPDSVTGDFKQGVILFLSPFAEVQEPDSVTGDFKQGVIPQSAGPQGNVQEPNFSGQLQLLKAFFLQVQHFGVHLETNTQNIY